MKNAVSVYCRLGFARKKNSELESGAMHPSWSEYIALSPRRTSSVNPSDDDPLLAELAEALAELGNAPASETEGEYNHSLLCELQLPFVFFSFVIQSDCY